MAHTDRPHPLGAGAPPTKTARKLEGAAEKVADSADRRTELAADRTIFAAERTYAAWVRTGLFALASGIGTRKLLEGITAEWIIYAAGALLVLFSAFCFAAAIWRQVHPGPPPPVPDARRIPPAVLILVNGFLILVSLAALLGVLLGRNAG
jgi:putative membrane protein